ncbi:7-carboxy-7-deazaguanine synthase QueE [Desulforhopalus singaporensis]|nr:7-carboxy-7-deazaguanine synthase QueE [Desulforhopalus singaporensis]
MFSSLQGEGPHTGRPAFFIRLSGCLEPFCPWCDTKDAWFGGSPASIEDIIQKVVRESHRFVVITGGEPFLQWDDGLSRLDRELAEMKIEVQYETSGKVAIPQQVRGEVICSPKYLSGKWHLARESMYRADAFKFVACRESIFFIDAFIAEHGIDRDRVWLMPKGKTRKEQTELLQFLWEHCVKKGYRLSARLHILCFDQKKGV